jgi:hypothetical protein
VFEAEVKVLELQVKADDRSIQDAQRLSEQLLAGLIAIQDHDRRPAHVVSFWPWRVPLFCL